MPKKDSPVMQVLIAVIGLVIAGLLVDGIHEIVDMHNTLIVHTSTLATMSGDVKEIKDTMKDMPTRKEVDNKIAALRSNLGSDNRHEHAAELIQDKNSNERN